MSSSKMNVAVIGLGWVATQRHIPIILHQPRWHFYGVVDKRAERIQKICAKSPWLQSSLSHEGEMPWEDAVQAVLIATDPPNHYPLAKKMLLAGKHVLMEKPLTMSVDEAHDLQEMAERQEVSCCVVHNFQFARSTLRLQSMILEERLGKIQSIEASQWSNPRRRLPTWYEQLPFGLFYDESPHLLYMLEALAGGEIQRLSSTVLRKTGQNTPVSVSATYRRGAFPIRLNMNFTAALSEWHIAVQGTEGVGIVDLFRDILVALPNDGAHRAREILASSAAAIGTHLWGFLQSGALLARGSLFYGAEVVWEKFVGQIEGAPAPEISVERGARVVVLQHELMTKSAFFDLPSDEHSDAE